MNRSSLIRLILAVLLFAPGFSAGGEEALLPAASIDRYTHEFEPVIAGTDVTHRFGLSNRGKAPLEIINVYTG